MFALVQSGSITKFFSGNQAVTIGDIQYPKSIFTLWSKAEREAISIYEVVFNDSNKKNEQWYVNTNPSYAFAITDGVGQVTASYGTATSKSHVDILYTEQDKTDGNIPANKDVGDVKTRGLKYNLIKAIKKQAAGELSNTDWYIVRKADAGTAVPSAITTHRAAVRTKAASMETAITNAANTPALETLYTYTTNDAGVTSRPLGEFPRLDS